MSEIEVNDAKKRLGLLVLLSGGALVGLLIALSLAFFGDGSRALVVEEGHLFVEESHLFGASPFVPDPAFEPVALPDGVGPSELPLRACDGREDCERAFYDALLVLVEGALREGKSVDEARQLIVRAQLFPTISLEERAPLDDLAGGIHYAEALVRLETAKEVLLEVLKKLERSRIAGGALDRSREEVLIKAVREALFTLEGATSSGEGLL